MTPDVRLPLCALACALPVPALAEITAAELWEIWRGEGQVSVSAAQAEPREDGLSVMGVAIKLGDGDSRGTFLIDRIEMDDTADAMVAISVPDPVRFTGAGLPEAASLVVDYSEADIVASRDGGRIRYVLDAPQIAVELSGDMPDLPGVDYVMEETTATLETGERIDQPVSIRSSVARMAGTVESPAAQEGTGRVAFSAAELDSTMDIARPDRFSNALGSQVLSEFDTSTAFRDLQLDIDGVGPRGPVSATVSLGAGRVASSASGDSLSSDVDTRDIVIGTSGGSMPDMPQALSIGTLSYAVTLPLAEDREGPLRLSLTADAIAPAEPVWAMLDPEKALPRDPASLTLSLAATARPAQTPAPGLAGPSPFDIQSFDLQEFNLSVLGAEVSGSGQIDQPLDQLGAEGQVTLIATGLMELIATLAALGILPPEQELGARMGLAFATVPLPDGAGLKTELVFGPDGAIRLNGMQVR